MSDRDDDENCSQKPARSEKARWERMNRKDRRSGSSEYLLEGVSPSTRESFVALDHTIKNSDCCDSCQDLSHSESAPPSHRGAPHEDANNACRGKSPNFLLRARAKEHTTMRAKKKRKKRESSPSPRRCGRPASEGNGKCACCDLWILDFWILNLTHIMRSSPARVRPPTRSSAAPSPSRSLVTQTIRKMTSLGAMTFIHPQCKRNTRA